MGTGPGTGGIPGTGRGAGRGGRSRAGAGPDQNPQSQKNTSVSFNSVQYHYLAGHEFHGRQLPARGGGMSFLLVDWGGGRPALLDWGQSVRRVHPRNLGQRIKITRL